MLQDVIHPPQEQLSSIDDVSSPLSAQILQFCFPQFPETLQNSEVTSSSNCCYEESSPYTAKNLSLQPDPEKLNSCQENNGNNTGTTTPSPTTTAAANANNVSSSSNNTNNNLSIIFDPQDDIDNEISASIDFTSSTNFSIPQFTSAQQEQFDFSSVQPELSLTDMVSTEGLTQYPDNCIAPFMGPPLSAIFEEGCLSSVPSYVPLNPSSPSCSFLVPGMNTYMSAGTMSSSSLPADNSGIFGGGILLGSELPPQEMEFQDDNGGIYCPDSISRVFNTVELQAISNENQQFVGGVGSSTPLASEISSLEDSAFKVGKLSVEQRKEKIHRYMKKRNERNFSKKIKYACRKTLADSRPRVRGRFAKNDDFGETNRGACSNHEEDDEDDIVVKEEEDMVNSSDIFAHISGVNSFKCNYSIQSWI